jgi:hypothetical protein
MFEHAWTTFCADFPEDPDPAESRCQGVGDHLATRLRETDICVTGTDSWRDCGYQVDCRVNSKAVYFFVSYLGQWPDQYVLCCTSNRGFFSWLRGISDVPERWKLARAVHRIMVRDPSFKEIRWYIEQGWAAGSDEPWVAEPA